MQTNENFLTELFFGQVSQSDVEASLLKLEAAEKARVEAVKAEIKQKAARHPCPRCAGAGKISAFKHVSNGVCFACDGEGYKP